MQSVKALYMMQLRTSQSKSIDSLILIRSTKSPTDGLYEELPKDTLGVRCAESWVQGGMGIR